MGPLALKNTNLDKTLNDAVVEIRRKFLEEFLKESFTTKKSAYWTEGLNSPSSKGRKSIQQFLME